MNPHAKFNNESGVPQPFTQGEIQTLHQQGVVPARGARDIFFAIAFVLNFLGFCALTGYSGIQYSKRQHQMMTNGTVLSASGGDDDPGFLDTVALTDVFLAIGIAAGASVVFAAFWLWLAKAFPRQLIIFTIVANVLAYLGVAGAYGYLALKHNATWYPAVAFGIVGLLHLCLFLLWRRRIPFAATLLSTVSTVTSRYPGTVVTPFASLFVLLGWTALFSFGGTTTLAWAPANWQGYLLYVYLLFSFYWVQQVIRATAFVTISGAFASWYFLGGNVGLMPSSPTAGAAKRALTTSFGSICFGSLLVALIQTLRAIFRSMRSKRNALLLCLVDCILGCIEALLRKFNKYAWTIVAAKGTSYCEAASACAALIGSHGIAALINESIVSSVLAFGALFGGVVGFTAGAVGGVLLLGTASYAWLLPAVAGLFIGFVTLSQAMLAIDAGITTIFVCFAMDPQALAHNDVVLFNQFQATANLI